MAPRKPADSTKILSTRTLVNIKRDQTAATPRVVWLHEIPILEAMFGEGNVVHIEPEALDDGYSAKPSADLLPYNKKQDRVPPPSESLGIGFVFIGDAKTEFSRLAELYGMHPEVKESMAENVYGRFQEGRFAKLVGSPELVDLPDQQLRGLCTAYGADPAKVAESKGDALLALAEEVGVQLG